MSGGHLIVIASTMKS